MDFFIDVSFWQSAWTLNKFKLLKQYGMKAMIIRAGYGTWLDKLAVTLIGYAREMNIPFALYWYLYPGIPFDVQIRAFIAFANNYPDCKSYFIDFEEYRSISGEIYSKAYLEKFYKNSYDYLVKVLPGKKVGIYTGSWCVNAYFPGIVTWMNKNKEWYAFYVKYFTWFQQYIASLGGHWADNSKPISISNLPKILEEVWKHAPQLKLPDGITGWAAWQCFTFVAFTELTYGQRNLDYNIAPPETYREYFGIGEAPIPEPPVVVEPPQPEPNEPPYVPQKYKVTAWALNIRSGAGAYYPSTNKYLVMGNVILSIDEQNGWIKMDKGWVSKLSLREYTFIPGTLYKATTGLNIRSEPDVHSLRLSGIPYNGTVKVDEINNGWAKLTDGGYAFAYYLVEV